MLLTNNEAKLQEIFYDDERHQDRIQPNQPAAKPSSTRLQNDTTISSTVKQVDTLFHRTRLDLFSRIRLIVPVTVNTLRLLEMSDYCCMVVLFHLRKKTKNLILAGIGPIVCFCLVISVCNGSRLFFLVSFPPLPQMKHFFLVSLTF